MKYRIGDYIKVKQGHSYTHYTSLKFEDICMNKYYFKIVEIRKHPYANTLSVRCIICDRPSMRLNEYEVETKTTKLLNVF